MGKRIKLPLSVEEKSKLRLAGVKLAELHTLEAPHLAKILDSSLDSAQKLIGLAEFQRVPSIGFELADKLVNHLKIYSLHEISDKDGAQLFDQLEQEMGIWTDSCVEDQLRCVIHFANNPTSTEQWFYFTEERKAYRNSFGYPKERPKTPWYEIKGE
ncbi:Pathogenicity locus [Terribacillus halophilus]|uniref:Pathogenicity locus n=1 Tax=Terribacillus halophilus TaxID=361279 RepID=A0A1G6J5L9_9BACI|nr:helix-hairpin-helix domain-containing protein [Terribacillus halophilus]SDC13919.1 Pathogenicity locus [Terribacillus halophilus]